MKFKLCIMLSILSTNSYALQLHNGFTFGPVLNWNIGAKKHSTSIGFNVYYWEMRGELPLSIGVGYERSSDAQNLVYSEIQTGAVLFGTSSGILYSDKNGLGFQGSVWGNFIGGVNLRYRYLNESLFCPGLYLTVPMIKASGSLA